jgi:pilus assembly protein Flp/PilA
MTKMMKTLLARLNRCEEGATLVEYGIALGLALAVGTGALATLGGSVSGKMTEASETLDGTEADPAS